MFSLLCHQLKIRARGSSLKPGFCQKGTSICSSQEKKGGDPGRRILRIASVLSPTWSCKNKNKDKKTEREKLERYAHLDKTSAKTAAHMLLRMHLSLRLIDLDLVDPDTWGFMFARGAQSKL